MKKHSWLYSIFWVSIVAAFFATINFGREWYNNYRVDQEISRLRAQVGQLETERLSILNLKDELISQDFLEAEARIKLGLKKPGETAVVIPEGQVASEDVVLRKNRESDSSNLQLWWNYFFRKQ